MYKAIGFDLGGVIIKYGVTDQLTYIAEELGVSQTALMDPYERFRPQLDAGMISNRQYWQALVKESGSTLDPQESAHLWTDTYIKSSPISKNMLDLIDRLKANEYRVGLFSNIDPERLGINRRRHIFSHFEVALFSCDVKMAKPDVRTYQLLASKLEVDPSEMVFVDDLAVNIEGARQAGCHGIRFLDYNQLVGELKQAGIAV